MSWNIRVVSWRDWILIWCVWLLLWLVVACQHASIKLPAGWLCFLPLLGWLNLVQEELQELCRQAANGEFPLLQTAEHLWLNHEVQCFLGQFVWGWFFSSHFTQIPKYPNYFCNFTCHNSYTYRPPQGMRKRQWLPWHPSPTLIPTQWVSTPTPWTLPTLIPTPSVSIQTLLALIPMLSVLIRKTLGMNFGKGFCWFVSVWHGCVFM